MRVADVTLLQERFVHKLSRRPRQLSNLNWKSKMLQNSRQYHQDLFLGRTGWNIHILLNDLLFLFLFPWSASPPPFFSQNWPWVLIHRGVTVSVLPLDYSCLDHGWTSDRSNLEAKRHGREATWSILCKQQHRPVWDSEGSWREMLGSTCSSCSERWQWLALAAQERRPSSQHQVSGGAWDIGRTGRLWGHGS